MTLRRAQGQPEHNRGLKRVRYVPFPELAEPIPLGDCDMKAEEIPLTRKIHDELCAAQRATWKWIAGLLLAAILASSGWVYNGMIANADRIRDQDRELGQVSASLQGMDYRLQRIEAKLDRAIEER